MTPTPGVVQSGTLYSLAGEFDTLFSNGSRSKPAGTWEASNTMRQIGLTRQRLLIAKVEESR